MAKKGALGCSFPVLILIALVTIGLVVVGVISGPLFKSVHLPFTIEQPEISLPAATVFHVLGFPITNSIIATWVTMAFLVIFSVVATRNMKLVPGRLQSVFEFMIGSLYNFCRSVAGEENGRKFFPVVATIFLFVIFNAWLSLIPGFGSIAVVNAEGHHLELLRGANTDIYTPLAIALVSFACVEYYGLRALGIKYLGKFFSFGQFLRGIGQLLTGKLKAGLGSIFSGFISIFVGVVELVSELSRVISFTFRLFGNMTAGEILLLMITFLAPFLFSDIFYLLEILVGFVQALIFAGLTLVFLTLATAHGQH
ncbi:MAG: FoF1 ATP synthase subunit a [Chloroflexota bacterium]